MKQDEQNRVSRRKFLQSAVLAGAGLATPRGSVAARETIAQDAPVQTPPSPDQAFPRNIKRVDAVVHVNQAGFLPWERKRAVVLAMDTLPGNTFVLVDDDVTPQIQYHSTLTEVMGAQIAPYAQYHRYYIADFTDFQRPGRYRVRLADGSLSFTFAILEDMQLRLLPLLLTYFRVQRCGDTHPLLHDVCHHDDGKIVGGPRDGQSMDASGGWHDAGDYLKFVETTSYVCAMMLYTQKRFGQHFPRTPEHRDLPPLLAEARIGLDWLLKMHPTPEEFYYQVGDSSDHESWRLPEQDVPEKNKNWKPRPILYGVGANLAGRTSAAFAMASVLYRRYDHRFAQRCLEVARSAYKLGLAHPEIVTTKPDDFYPEKTWEDDMAWAGVALYEATNEMDYLLQALKFAHSAGAGKGGVEVYNTHAIAHSMLCRHASGNDLERLVGYLKEDAELARSRANNPYGLATAYDWGTSASAAGQGLTCLLYAEELDRDKAMPYVTVAREQRDFILGCNPFNTSFVIGAGAHYPQFPHHQVANLKNAELSGAVLGGPSDLGTYKKEKFTLEGCDFSVRVSSVDTTVLPDDIGVYRDAALNYVTNEPANDYTVNFLLLSTFYHDYMQLNKGEKI